MSEILPTPFRRIVVTGVECSGKTTLCLKRWRNHLAGLGCPSTRAPTKTWWRGKVQESTFDELHESPNRGGRGKRRSTHPGVVCDTGDLVLRMWSEAVLDFSWHPCCRPIRVWTCTFCAPPSRHGKKTLCAPLPRLEDRLALEEQYRAHLAHRHHLVAEGDTVEARLDHVMSQWPW